jgi:hypothetical protein
MGTWVGGRTVSGIAQISLAVAGLVLFTGGFLWFYASWFNVGERPGLLGPEAMLSVAGVGLVFLAWVWALGSSIAIIKSTPPN